jgi:hypothetical protein
MNQLVPLVELAFDTPIGQKTAATANPGLSYRMSLLPGSFPVRQSSRSTMKGGVE